MDGQLVTLNSLVKCLM